MPGYLVDQIDGTTERGSLTSALEAVYCHLAKTWMTAFAAPPKGAGDWRACAQWMRERNDKIEVVRAPHISGGKWAAIEILNCVNHIEVLLCAALALENDKWTLKRCAPTQQHLADNEEGVPSKVADLEGKDDKGEAFALEAYGGVDYRNNSKLALDMNALRQSKKARLLLAAHKSAWPSNLPSMMSASCEKRNGGPFKIEAAVVTKKWEQDHVLVIELTSITRDSSRPKEFS
ncbi:MAG: hypothetical protein ABI183_24550 [Polyangiaceae bacterium]